MQRFFLLVLVILLPLNAVADGKVFATALAVDVTIPDQRALIHFSNGVERLVIETRFTGPGSNFAWVVPLPSQPVIEAATTGLFPTLQHLFQPQIVHEVTPLYLYVLAIIGMVILFAVLARIGRGFVPGVLLLLLLGLLATLFIPALGKAKAGGGADASAGITILERNLVGDFETTTIAATKSDALTNWLHDHGFAVSSNSLPVIESYVKASWVFVATKLQRAATGTETSTPHPLSFMFKTEKPVYPMRLTGVDNGALGVELYVFGEHRARAKHFKVERCTRPSTPRANSERAYRDETLIIAHPKLVEWVGEAAVATKLTATLSPEQMREDVWIEWRPFSERRNTRYSQRGAVTLALNWSVGLLLGATVLLGLTGLASRFDETLRRIGIAALCCVGIGGLIYAWLPKTEVRLVRMPHVYTKNTQHNVGNLIYGEPLERAREIVGRISTGETFKVVGGTYRGGWTNFLSGALIREEDSPGNFVLREIDGTVFFVTFDGSGRETIISGWEPEPPSR